MLFLLQVTTEPWISVSPWNDASQFTGTR